MRACEGDLTVGIPGNRYLPDRATVLAAGGGLAGSVRRVEQLLVGLDGDEVVAESDELVDRLLPADRHRDADRPARHVSEPGGVRPEGVGV